MGLYIVGILMLGLLLTVGPITRGVKGWFELGGAGIQPVEVMKLILVLVLAKYFSRRHVEISRMRHLVISGLYVGLASLLVFLQPDLGSALILGAIWLAILFFSGIQRRHVAIFLVLVIILAAVSWTWFLLPYQKTRITGFLDPYRDPRGAGYNTIQAMIAAGSGNIWGKGIGYGTQSHLNFLPEAETDFIFSAFTEETGIVGAVILLGLFGVFFWRILKIGIHAEDNFSKLYVLGFAASLFAAFFIHIAINLGLLPVTGIGLPLISYGGSSLLTTLIGLGILQSIRINSRPEVG
jgi:rod shape determining protein RodA